MYLPTPGWLALRLAPCGHELALSILGAGLLIDVASDDPAVVAKFYTDLAGSTEPLHELRLTYIAVGERYPYLLDTLAPLLTWAEQTTPQLEDACRRAAGLLALVEFNNAQDVAGGDLIGQVKVELDIMTRRRRPKYEYLELSFATAAALTDPRLPNEGDSVGDFWCASGVRVMGMIIAMQMMGRDPWSVRWTLRDPEPVNLALAAINMATMDITDVTFGVAAGVMTGLGPLRMASMKDLESGKIQAYSAPESATGLDGVDMIADAIMHSESIMGDAEREAVRQVLVDAQHGQGVAIAVRHAVAKRRK